MLETPDFPTIACIHDKKILSGHDFGYCCLQVFALIRGFKSAARTHTEDTTQRPLRLAWCPRGEAGCECLSGGHRA